MFRNQEIYVTTKEVANALQVRVDQVRMWTRTGRLKAYKLSDSKMSETRIALSDLEKFLKPVRHASE